MRKGQRLHTVMCTVVCGNGGVRMWPSLLLGDHGSINVGQQGTAAEKVNVQL